jgi:hypothetical protein
VALVRIDVSQERIASIIRMKTVSELGTTLAITELLVTANVVPRSLILSALMIETIHSSETSVLTRATRCHIPEDDILHTQRRENLKSYVALTDWAL